MTACEPIVTGKEPVIWALSAMTAVGSMLHGGRAAGRAEEVVVVVERLVTGGLEAIVLFCVVGS
jgi:hypothetical protein